VQALELLHRIDMVFVLHYDHRHEEGRHQAPEGEPASSVKIRVLLRVTRDSVAAATVQSQTCCI